MLPLLKKEKEIPTGKCIPIAGGRDFPSQNADGRGSYALFGRANPGEGALAFPRLPTVQGKSTADVSSGNDRFDFSQTMARDCPGAHGFRRSGFRLGPRASLWYPGTRSLIGFGRSRPARLRRFRPDSEPG